MGATTNIAIRPHPRGFYTTGDVVSGEVEVQVIGKLSITDVQVKLRCDGYTAAQFREESEKRKRKREKRKTGTIRQFTRLVRDEAVKQIGKAGNWDEDTIQIMNDGLRMVRSRERFFETTTNAFTSPSAEEPKAFSTGHYVFPFSILLTDGINRVPPHAPLYRDEGLKNGIFWTVKAVIRRPGVLQNDVRTTRPIGIYPCFPRLVPLDLTRRTQLRRDFGSHSDVTAYFSMPEQGLAQDSGPLPFTLQLEAVKATKIDRIKVDLVLHIASKTKGIKEKSIKTLPLGTVNVRQPAYHLQDFSPYLQALHLTEILPPSLSLASLALAYEVVVTLGLPTPAEIRSPITVLSPSDTLSPRPPSVSSKLAADQKFERPQYDIPRHESPKYESPDFDSPESPGFDNPAPDSGYGGSMYNGYNGSTELDEGASTPRNQSELSFEPSITTAASASQGGGRDNSWSDIGSRRDASQPQPFSISPPPRPPRPPRELLSREPPAPALPQRRPSNTPSAADTLVPQVHNLHLAADADSDDNATLYEEPPSYESLRR